MLLEEFPFEPGFRLTDGDLLNKVAAEPAYSVDNTVTATGSSQSMAYGIRATVTVITAGVDNAGVRLPFPKVGRLLLIMNYTATGKRVYPFDQELINGSVTADIPFQAGMMIVCTSNSTWAATEISTDTSGDIVLVASDADTATGDGHFVEISGGAGGTVSGDGGPVTITSGVATGSPGDAGDVTLQGATSTNGAGGDILIQAGNSSTGRGGNVTVTAGTGTPPGVMVVVAPPNTTTPHLKVIDPGVTQPTGLASASVKLAVQGADNSGSAIAITSMGTGGFAGLRFYAALGTSAAPQPLNAAAVIGAIQCFSWDGSAWVNRLSLNAIIEPGNTWTPTSTPTRMLWQTTPVSSTALVPAMALTAAGNLLIAADSGVPDPGHKLHVQGNSQITLGLGVWGVTPPVARPTVTGSRGGNAALASLLTAIAATGLITDSTTA